MPFCSLSLYQENRKMFRPLFRSLTNRQLQLTVQRNAVAIPRQQLSCIQMPVQKLFVQPRWYSTPQQQQCWQCGTPTKPTSVICADCHSIQPVQPEVNYFDLLLEG